MLLYWIFFSKWVALGLSLFRTFLCYWDSLILLLKDIYCILGNVCPRFNFAYFAFIVSGRIKDWANSNVKNTPHLTQLCLGELKIAGWNRVKITLFTVSADFQVFVKIRPRTESVALKRCQSMKFWDLGNKNLTKSIQ